MKNLNLTIADWPEYELLDSGNNKKLERYGAFTLVRPETQALWAPRRPKLWSDANAEFERHGEKGTWRERGIPESWQISWNDLAFTVRLTSFKHTGVFPEQAANWEWIRERCAALSNPKILNLFGYTGIATLAAAKAPGSGGAMGAHVTHVDASKQSNAWAKENAALSEIPAHAVRYILDDALKFVEREVRRGASYDGIILDPPAFGRGAKGEVWHIEEDLPRLLAGLAKIFAAKPGSFFLLNGYAAGYSPASFKQAVEDHMKDAARAEGEFGELRLKESGGSDRVLPSGIYVRFVR